MTYSVTREVLKAVSLHKIRAWWCVEEAEVRYRDFYRVGADLLLQLNVGLDTRYCQDVKLPQSTPRGKIRGMEVEFHSLLTSALYGSEWSTYAGAGLLTRNHIGVH